MGLGWNCREGKSYVFYQVTPTDICQDQLDRLGNTWDQYWLIALKVIYDTIKWFGEVSEFPISH